MYNDLKGKVVLVTGAASKRGMGRAIALRMAQEGCIVAVNGRPGKRTGADDVAEGWTGLPDVVAEIEAMGGKAIALEADISKEDQVDAMFDKLKKELGRLDILVNCASVCGASALTHETSTETWDWVMDVNINGLFNTSKAAAAMMVEQKSGNIINISSLHGKIASPGIVPYNCSKFATVGLSATLAKEYVEYGIRANCIIAGCFSSDMPSVKGSVRERMRNGGLTEDEAVAECFADVIKIIPMKRIGKVSEMASLIAFLSSDESGYITGQAINIDGGYLMEH